MHHIVIENLADFCFIWAVDEFEGWAAKNGRTGLSAIWRLFRVKSTEFFCTMHFFIDINEPVTKISGVGCVVVAVDEGEGWASMPWWRWGSHGGGRGIRLREKR